MNAREVENLSAYLDGQLSPTDSARLEARLESDPALAAALEALRETRALLRQMPRRRAPRNFTLTRQLVGKKPPLPRAYPILRFAAAAAVFLLAMSFLDLRAFVFGAAAPALYAEEAAGAEEAPMLQMAMPETETAPQATAVFPESTLAPLEETSRAIQATPSPKSAGETVSAPRFLSAAQILLAAVAVISAATMFLMKIRAARKWRAQ